jgi:hypothetical protein
LLFALLFSCHLPSPQAEDLLLPLQVFAVILSAAKDPEEANHPKPLEPFSHTTSAVALAFVFVLW